MLDPTLAIYVTAVVALVATPGPAVLYVVARSLEGGRRAGLAATLGISAGTLAHVGLAAGGVSALLAASAPAFRAVKLLGAIYLIWLGVRTWRSGRSAAPITARRRAARGIVLEGALVNLTNPKTAVFFLAFLPQFIDPTRGAVSQAVLLGAIFVALALVSDAVYAWLAGGLAGSGWLAGAGSLTRRLSGGVLIALGLGAAFSGGLEAHVLSHLCNFRDV